MILPEQSQDIIVAKALEKRHLLPKEREVLLSCISKYHGSRLSWKTIASDYMSMIDTNEYPEVQTGERLMIVYKNIKARKKQRTEEDTANATNPLTSAESVIIDPQTTNDVERLSTMTSTVNIPLTASSLLINEINETGEVAGEVVITDVTVATSSTIPLRTDDIAFDDEEVKWLFEYAHTMAGRDIVGNTLKAAHLRKFKTFTRSINKMKSKIKDYKRTATYKKHVK
jgi:hypothetical protein